MIFNGGIGRLEGSISLEILFIRESTRVVTDQTNDYVRATGVNILQPIIVKPNLALRVKEERT